MVLNEIQTNHFGSNSLISTEDIDLQLLYDERHGSVYCKIMPPQLHLCKWNNFGMLTIHSSYHQAI